MSAQPAPSRTRLVLIGASGRMGQAILRAAAEFPRLRLTGALTSARSAALGTDSGVNAGLPASGLALTGELAPLLSEADVVMDFSTAAATAAHLAACVSARCALLLGTTGFAAGLEREFAAAAREIPLLVAPNTSLGVTLLIELARTAAAALPGFSLAIRETHHRDKRDAPSGTALALAAALAQARPGQQAAEIPVQSLREGEVVGEHAVVLSGAGEELVLGHRALERSIFARGALAAALWLGSKPPGRYSMRDVLAAETAT